MSVDQSLIVERRRGVIVKIVTFMRYKICHEHELAMNRLLAAYLIQLLSSQLVIKVIYCLVVFYHLANILFLTYFSSLVVLFIAKNNTTGNFPQNFGNHFCFYASLSLQIA